MFSFFVPHFSGLFPACFLPIPTPSFLPSYASITPHRGGLRASAAEVELVWLLAKGLQVVEECKQALGSCTGGAPWRGFSQEIWEERGQLHWWMGWCLCLAPRLYAMRGQQQAWNAALQLSVPLPHPHPQLPPRASGPHLASIRKTIAVGQGGVS